MPNLIFKSMPNEVKFSSMNVMLRETDDGKGIKFTSMNAKYQMEFNPTPADIRRLILWLAVNYTDEFNHYPENMFGILERGSDGLWKKKVGSE